jgi:dTDP-4-amino-4,6-dideoxygalactose transaminase
MIRLTKPEVGDALGAIKAVLDSGMLVQGKVVEEFEASVARYVNRKHGIALNSGTSAIYCSLVALGVGKGDEVLVPDFTFPATANAVISAGATPVLVDIDPETFNIDLGALEGALTPKARAVMPVDLFGLPADLEAISDLCRRHGLLMIEDSACALGASYKERRCGSYGEASVISFHPRKIVTTGEGGMVLTDRDDIADLLRQLRNHGMEDVGGHTEFVAAGHNLRMNEIEACMGMEQMRRIEELIRQRRRVAKLYRELLHDSDDLVLPVEPEGMFHTYQSYVVMIDEDIDRDRVMMLMRKRGVETTIGTYAIHAQLFYRNRFGMEAASRPSSYRAFRHSLSLPIYASMDPETVQLVVRTLKDCVAALATGK